jgi:hypothetical protein
MVTRALVSSGRFGFFAMRDIVRQGARNGKPIGY